MKEKGFTLIELLAVIVILAIIALIAVPIILNIIEDARNEANQRSIDLYGTAVKNAAARYQLNDNSTDITGKYDSNEEGTELTHQDTNKGITLAVEYDGERVYCEIIEISANGEVSLADCKVSGKSVDNTYGEVEEDDKADEGNEGESGSPQPIRYYSWSSGSIGGDLPSDATENASEIDTKVYPFYLGLDVDSSNKVTAAYACFIRNGTEYCLKGEDGGASYATNQDILRDAFSDVLDTCSFEDNNSYCRAVGLYAIAYSRGSVSACDDDAGCDVSVSGNFECSEY